MQTALNDRIAPRPEHARRLRWRRLLWALVYPAHERRVMLTLPGLVLIGLSVGIGVAAYNTTSNILFITLSLLLGCLILSGVLSWFNFHGLSWRFEVDSPMRVGRTHPVTLHIRNTKKLLPTYSLVFEVTASSQPKPLLIPLRERIDPQAGVNVGWSVCPQKRGLEKLALSYVGSLFPFGFLYKGLAAGTACEVIVWPAPVEYRRFPVAAWRRLHTGEPVARAGQNGDLLALRRYQAGDSHRQIHWKASARQRRLVVRQFAADNQEALVLLVETSAASWKTPAQFELLCSFAATLAEDLFKQGRLDALAIDREAPRAVRGVRDLEAFLDRLALLSPGTVDESGGPPGERRANRRNVLTFGPDGARGVAAYVDGEKAATT